MKREHYILLAGFAIAAFFLLSFGCTATRVSNPTFELKMPPDYYCKGTGVCVCMTCKNETPTFWQRVGEGVSSILPFLDYRADVSLKGGSCRFEECTKESYEELLKNMQESKNDRVPAMFMVGQGPAFPDFEFANQYCNNTMKLVVKWLVGRDGAAPAIPESRKAGCYLEHQVMPAYLYYTGGKNISAERAGEIAKALSDVGPVIITPEVNYNSSNWLQVVEQISAMRSNCKDCLIALVPPANDTTLLAFVMSESAANVDLVGQGVFANEYEFCRPSHVISSQLNFSRYVRGRYQKPLIWVYFAVANGSNKGGTCSWDEESVGTFYNYTMAHIPMLASEGIIGIAPYQLYEGSGPLPCTGSPSICNASLLSAGGSARQPSFYRWFSMCQLYHANDSVAPLVFAQDGKTSCSDIVGNLNIFGFAAGVDVGAVPSGYSELAPDLGGAYSCDTCFSQKETDPPEAIFGKLGEPSIDPEACGQFPELPSYADQLDIDPLLLLAIMAAESSGNQYATSCVDESSTGCNPHNLAINPADYGGPSKVCDAGEKSCAYGLMQCIEYPGSIYKQLGEPVPYPASACGGENYNPFDPGDSICCGANKFADFYRNAKEVVKRRASDFGPSPDARLDAQQRHWFEIWYALVSYHGGSGNAESWLNKYARQRELDPGFCQGISDVVVYFSECTDDGGYGVKVLEYFKSFLHTCPSFCKGGSYPTDCPYKQPFLPAISLAHPTDGGCVGDWFCKPPTSYRDHYHSGIDIRGSSVRSDKIFAAMGGKVTFVGSVTGGGNTIEITNEASGVKIVYYHIKCGGIFVSQGDLVNIGQQIAVMGGDDACAGDSTGKHLHFEVWASATDKSTRVDPNVYLNYQRCGTS